LLAQFEFARRVGKGGERLAWHGAIIPYRARSQSSRSHFA
jgi:hypothetical protein